MSVFLEKADFSLDRLYAFFGNQAVFQPALGDSVALTIIVETESDWQPGGQVQWAEPRIEISYRRTDIDRKVKRGETFTMGSTVYTVVSMAEYPDCWTDFEGKCVVEA